MNFAVVNEFSISTFNNFVSNFNNSIIQKKLTYDEFNNALSDESNLIQMYEWIANSLKISIDSFEKPFLISNTSNNLYKFIFKGSQGYKFSWVNGESNTLNYIVEDDSFSISGFKFVQSINLNNEILTNLRNQINNNFLQNKITVSELLEKINNESDLNKFRQELSNWTN
ncbi:MAG: hypothetical protein K2L64_02955, partial [Ureaplasma sp.]|nr:hypothetical protein [Ureaplasma sp.]